MRRPPYPLILRAAMAKVSIRMRFPPMTGPVRLVRSSRRNVAADGEVLATFGLGRQARDQFVRVFHAAVLSIAAIFIVAGTAFCQPPGTQPPRQIFDPDSESRGGLEFRGFMMLDESGVGVMVPQMTYERWKEIEFGESGPEQSFVLQSLQIDGNASGGRAELTVALRFSVDGTNGSQMPIPLRMGNFHLLSPPEVSGVDKISGIDEHSVTFDPESGGYVLLVRASKKCEAILTMKVSARVEEGTTSSLQFRLPDVPSTVKFDTPGEKTEPEIVGRGDEVLQSRKLGQGKSRHTVESGGGSFMLRWGGMRREDDTSPLLEVETQLNVRWVAPEDQPIASVTMFVRNLRGAVSEFDVQLPPGAVVLDTPELGASGQFIDVPASSISDQSEPLHVVIPPDEQQQRIELNLELQLSNTQATASAPLNLQVPDVVGAIRQRGEIRIQTGNDYRLRWQSRPWIQSVVGDGADESTSNRRYAFRFERGGLTLPVYLSAKQRRVRLTCTTEISLTDTLASLEMTINASGQSSDGRGLNVDLKGWKLRSIVDTETGEELEYYSADQFQEIEMNSIGADESAPVRIVAERDLKAGNASFKLPLPRIIKVDENQVIQTSTVVVRSTGRSAFVLDLPKSTGLDRLGMTPDFGPIEPNVHRFRVLPPDAPAIVAGSMVRQTPRIDLASSAAVQLDSGELRTTVDWTLTSLVDLEGRLPIEIPEPLNSSMGKAGDTSSMNLLALRSEFATQSDTDASTSFPETGSNVTANRWTVTVEDAAAVVRHLEGNRYELVSDRLADGTLSIRWWNSQQVDPMPANESMKWISLPRPNMTDVSLQGDTEVTLVWKSIYRLADR